MACVLRYTFRMLRAVRPVLDRVVVAVLVAFGFEGAGPDYALALVLVGSAVVDACLRRRERLAAVEAVDVAAGLPAGSCPYLSRDVVKALGRAGVSSADMRRG